MPRIRSIHPDLHRDKTLSTISATAERTFVRLWCHLDDDGRGEDDPDLLKADLYPRHRDVTADHIETDLQELAAAGLIIRYTVNGDRYLSCKPDTWATYQRPQKRQDSKLPGPERADTPPVQEESRNGKRPVAPVGEGRGEVEEKELAPAKPPRERDYIFEAITDSCGLNRKELTASARGAANKAAKELRDIGASPEGIHARAAIYRKKWPDATLTPSALAKNYAQLGVTPNGSRASPRDDECADCRQPLDDHDQQLHDMLVKAG
jgi:hypothetical protein